MPVVDHLGRFVEDLNALVLRDPAFGFQYTAQRFPSVLPGPEEIGRQGAGAATNNLIDSQCDVLRQPENLEQKTSLVSLGGVARGDAISIHRGASQVIVGTFHATGLRDLFTSRTFARTSRAGLRSSAACSRFLADRSRGFSFAHGTRFGAQGAFRDRPGGAGKRLTYQPSMIRL